MRTPIFLLWPGRIKPGRHAFLASAIDLAPTILRACGIQPPSEMTGVNLLEVSTGESVDRQAVFGEVFGHDDVALGDPDRNVTHRWMRRGRWKLIVPQDGGEPVELYDLVADRKEIGTWRRASAGRARYGCVARRLWEAANHQPTDK